MQFYRVNGEAGKCMQKMSYTLASKFFRYFVNSMHFIAFYVKLYANIWFVV